MDGAFASATLLMLLLNLCYAVIGMVVGVLSLKLVDRFFLRNLDLEEEIKKGNVAAAIFASTLVLFVAILIGLALGR